MSARTFDLIFRGISILTLAAFLVANGFDYQRRVQEEKSPARLAAADYRKNEWDIREWCTLDGKLLLDQGIQSRRAMDDSGQNFETTYLFPFQLKDPKDLKMWVVLPLPVGKEKAAWTTWVPQGAASFTGLAGAFPSELRPSLKSVPLSPETSAALMALDQRAERPLPEAVLRSLGLGLLWLLLLVGSMAWGILRPGIHPGDAAGGGATAAGPPDGGATLVESKPSWMFAGLMLMGGVLFLGLQANFCVLRDGVDGDWNSPWLVLFMVGMGGVCLVFGAFVASGSVAIKEVGIAFRAPLTAVQTLVPFDAIEWFLCRASEAKGLPVWVIQVGVRGGGKQNVWVVNASGGPVAEALHARVGPLLVPGLIARWNSGEDVDFDKLRVDRQSVRIKGVTGWTELPLDQLESATVEGPLLKLATAGPSARKANLAFTMIKNGVLIPEVLGHAIRTINPHCTLSWAPSGR